MLFDDDDIIEDRTEETDYPPSEIDNYESSSASGDDDNQQPSEEDDSDDESGFMYDGSELDSSSDDSDDNSMDSGSSYEYRKRRNKHAATEETTTPTTSKEQHAPCTANDASGAGGDNLANKNKILPFKKENIFLPTLEATPVSYFLHFVDEAFLSSVCEHTNKHAAAEQAARRAAAGDGDQEETWRPLDLVEFKVFVGISLHASIGLPVMYADDADFIPRYFRRFNENMTFDRYMQILRHLHFSSRDLNLRDIGMAADVVDYFNKKMSESYYPGRELWINNSVVVWDGVVACRERAWRGADDRLGVAVDVLTEPTAVSLKVRLTPSYLDYKRANGELARLVVEDLMSGKLDCGHSLYLDPFFCRISVARWLLERDTYCTGLLSGSESGGGGGGVGGRLAEGEHVARRRRGGVLVGQWRSSGKCNYLTTEFGVERTGSAKAPVAVSSYFRVTRREQREAMLRDSPGFGLRMRWHKHVFMLVLHMLTRNAHTFYVRARGAAAAGAAAAGAPRRLSFFEFRTEVALAMMPLPDGEGADDADEEEDESLDDGNNLDSGSETSRQL